MKIITCTGYHSSGSSAINDLISEYRSVSCFTDFEFRFLHDLDGISDLEFHLVECHNRLNSGHAIKRFLKLSRFNEGNLLSKRYSAYIDKKEYRKLTKQYVSSLTKLTHKGWWFYDLYEKGPKVYYLYQVINHLIKLLTGKRDKILQKEIMYCSHPTEEEFLCHTKNYVSSFINAVNKSGNEFVFLDQVVPSSNIERILRYFSDEIIVFVVDRDPRDIYFSQKYVLNESPVPTENVEKFCMWFRYTHTAGYGVPENNPHIVRVNFEDLIYDYKRVNNLVEVACGLFPEDHANQFARFNPKRSKSNTKVWKRFNSSQDIKDLIYIEKNLTEYLYDFDRFNDELVYGKDVAENTIF
ncbi:MAG: hypothetical protein HFG81_01750 [Dorea sp.]|nr:hypothetical protein [Dorea sp.]